MKRLIVAIFITIICINSFAVFAQSECIIRDKYIYHSTEVIETSTGKTIDPESNLMGMVILATVNNVDYLVITIGDEAFLYLEVVNVVENSMENDMRIKMYQGGEYKEGVGIYTADVLFAYDESKNSTIPEIIRVEVHNSPNIIIFSGIVRLNN